MKNKLFIFVLSLLIVIGISSSCFAVDAVLTSSSITTYTLPYGSGYNPICKVITLTWTDKSAADGTAFTTTIDKKELNGWAIEKVVTNPSATAPTTLYDITITDSDGVDIMGSSLLNRSATLSEVAYPQLVSGVYGMATFDGVLTVSISNNSVNSANGTIKIYFR